MSKFKASSVPSETNSNKKRKYSRLELPPEMLELIFAHSGNLLELTLVCPAFNGIISKSPLLSRKLKVRWTASSAQTLCLFQSDRKYGRLNLWKGDHKSWQQVKYFIEKHKRTLTDLKINAWYFELEPRQYFECLSTLCKNLKVLAVANLQEEIALMGALEFPKLEELIWDSGNKLMLRGWKTPKLKKFSQTGMHSLVPRNLQTINRNATMNFLREQPQLQNLEISSSSYVKAFLQAASVLPFSFNLASLKIVTYFHSPNIFSFLESQRQSLKVLSLESGWSDLQEMNFQNILTLELEELELITREYPSIGPLILQNKTIKKLTLRFKSSPSPNNDRHVFFIEACPNLETLSLENFRISKALSSSIVSKLTKLRNFSLTNCFFHFPLSEMDRYSSVEAFSEEYRERRVRKSFIAVNPQVEVVIRCPYVYYT